MEQLRFTCPGLEDGGRFPIQYTGRGEDRSPEILLESLDPLARTLAVIFGGFEPSHQGLYALGSLEFPGVGTDPRRASQRRTAGKRRLSGNRLRPPSLCRA